MFRVKFEETGETYQVGFQHFRPASAYGEGEPLDVGAPDPLEGVNLLHGADAKRYNGITNVSALLYGGEQRSLGIWPQDGPAKIGASAHCYKTDQFRKDHGRLIALDRLLEILFPEGSEFWRSNRAAFWFAYHSRSSVIVRTDGSIVRAKIVKDEVVAA